MAGSEVNGKVEKLETEVSDLRVQVAEMTVQMDNAHKRIEDNHKSVLDVIKTLVSQVEFTPVKLIAYGLATMIMSSVLVAVLSTVVKK